MENVGRPHQRSRQRIFGAPVARDSPRQNVRKPDGRDLQYFLNGKVAGPVQVDVPQRDLVAVGSAGDRQAQRVHPERFDGRQFDLVDPCGQPRREQPFDSQSRPLAPTFGPVAAGNDRGIGPLTRRIDAIVSPGRFEKVNGPLLCETTRPYFVPDDLIIIT